MADRLFITDPIQKRAIIVDEKGESNGVIMAPVVDGRPIPSGGELVVIDHGKPNSDGSFPILSRWRNGPAQVVTKAYRDNYDAIFSKN